MARFNLAMLVPADEHLCMRRRASGFSGSERPIEGNRRHSDLRLFSEASFERLELGIAWFPAKGAAVCHGSPASAKSGLSNEAADTIPERCSQLNCQRMATIGATASG